MKIVCSHIQHATMECRHPYTGLETEYHSQHGEDMFVCRSRSGRVNTPRHFGNEKQFYRLIAGVSILMASEKRMRRRYDAHTIASCSPATPSARSTTDTKPLKLKWRFGNDNDSNVKNLGNSHRCDDQIWERSTMCLCSTLHMCAKWLRWWRCEREEDGWGVRRSDNVAQDYFCCARRKWTVQTDTK